MVRRLMLFKIRRRSVDEAWMLWRRPNVNIDDVKLSAFSVGGRRWDQFLYSLVVACDEFPWRPGSSA